jgi:hypothetical protein
VRPVAARRRTTSASRLAIAAARAAQRRDGAALVGAALIAFAYFLDAGWTTGWRYATGFEEDIWLSWTPVEAFGAALLAAGAVLARRRGRAGREAVDGLLLAVGLLVLVGAVALASSPAETKILGVVGVTAIGALVLGASGALGVLTRRAREIALPRGAIGIGVAGAILGLAPLTVTVGNWGKSTLLRGISGDSGFPVAVEVAVAGLAAGAALLVLATAPRMRLHAAGALVGIGTLLALHLVGPIVHIVYWVDRGALGWGGPLGIAGGLLLVASGARVLLAARERAPEAAPTLAAG